MSAKTHTDKLILTGGRTFQAEQRIYKPQGRKQLDAFVELKGVRGGEGGVRWVGAGGPEGPGHHPGSPRRA